MYCTFKYNHLQQVGHDITEILLKVALNTINLNPKPTFTYRTYIIILKYTIGYLAVRKHRIQLVFLNVIVYLCIYEILCTN